MRLRMKLRSWRTAVSFVASGRQITLRSKIRAKDGAASLKMCQSFSPQMIKGHPCPFCKKSVYDKRKHPEQCIILFQVCLGWQRVHGAHEPDATRSVPKPESTVTRSLHAFFIPQSKPDHTCPPPDTGSRSAPQPHTVADVGPSARVRTMQNAGNTCYVNATLQSLVAALGDDDASAELRPLLSHCSKHQQEQRPLNPTGLFSLRSLMPRWKFDGRQQDAAEFLSFLLQGNTGTLQPVNWQGRTDGIPEVADQALTPLELPLTRICVTLQQACTAWYNHVYQRALAWAPDILPVTLARWTEGSKSLTPLDLRQRLSLPTWGAAQHREWRTYEVRSGVYHLGATLTAGHFRTYWFYPSEANYISATTLSVLDSPRPQNASM